MSDIRFFPSSQIVGPALYGLIYMKTVATFPQSIFIMSMVMVTISFTLMAFVRLPKERRAFDLARSRDNDDVEEAEPEIVQGEREETI